MVKTGDENSVGKCEFGSENRPPTTGPIILPRDQNIPIKENMKGLVLEVEISFNAALVTLIVPKQDPQKKRRAQAQIVLFDNPNKVMAMLLNRSPVIRMGRLPNLSEKDPHNSDVKDSPSEKQAY